MKWRAKNFYASKSKYWCLLLLFIYLFLFCWGHNRLILILFCNTARDWIAGVAIVWEDSLSAAFRLGRTGLGMERSTLKLSPNKNTAVHLRDKANIISFSSYFASSNNSVYAICVALNQRWSFNSHLLFAVCYSCYSCWITMSDLGVFNLVWAPSFYCTWACSSGRRCICEAMVPVEMLKRNSWIALKVLNKKPEAACSDRLWKGIFAQQILSVISRWTSMWRRSFFSHSGWWTHVRNVQAIFFYFLKYKFHLYGFGYPRRPSLPWKLYKRLFNK